MLYAGRYDSYLFQVTSSQRSVRMSVLVDYKDNEIGSKDISVYDINTVSMKSLSKNIVCSGVLKESSLLIDGYFGNLGILKQFINIFQQSKLNEAYKDKRYYVAEEQVNGHSLTTLVANELINSGGPIQGLNYSKFSSAADKNQAMKSNEDYKDLQLGILIPRIRNLDQLREVYDMSWYEDEFKRCKKDYKLITDEDEMRKALAEIMKSHEYVVVDTEYSNKNIYWRQKTPTRLFGLSVTWEEDQGVYFIFESKTSNFLSIEKTLKEIVETLNRCPNKIVVHNAFAELKILWNYGLELRVDYDTLLIEYNIDPDFRDGPRGLKELTRVYLGCETLELDGIINGRIVPELIPYFKPDVITIYACSDTDFARKILLFQKQFIDIDKASCKLDFRLVPMLAMAEYYGAKIDLNVLPALRESNLKDLNKVKAVAFKYLNEVGLRQQALTYLKEEDRNDNNINLVMSDPRFIEDMQELFAKPRKDKTKPLKKLTLRSPDDKRILYTILAYPPTRFNRETKTISANSDALADLMIYNSKSPIQFLKDDVKSTMIGTEYAKMVPKDDLVLLEKNKLENLKYPFAYILSKYKKLDKRETSFFEPLSVDNSEGWYYTNNSMISARTARVINPIQTLDGDLKMLVVPFSEMYYNIIFDMNQIEFRVMIGIANAAWETGCNKMINSGDEAIAEQGRKLLKKSLTPIIERLNHPLKDYHREGGSKLVLTTPAKMTKEQRSLVKPVHFSVPYGANAYNIAKPKLRKAKNAEEEQTIIEETEAILATWRSEMYPLYWYLEDVRDRALQKVPDEELPPRLKGKNVGRATNALGRFEYFILDARAPYTSEIAEMQKKTGTSWETAKSMTQTKLSEAHTAAIRREVGNYPIQSLAREIFFVGLLKLYDRIKQEGYFGKDRDFFKVLLSIFVHDECGCQVHRSVHLYKMYEMILECCLTKLKGHPNYYMGVAVAQNWSEGKDDKFEASVLYLEYCVKKYKANKEYYDDQAFKITSPRDYAFDGLREFFNKSIVAEFKQDMLSKGITLEEAVMQTDNYYISTHIDDWGFDLIEKSEQDDSGEKQDGSGEKQDGLRTEQSGSVAIMEKVKSCLKDNTLSKIMNKVLYAFAVFGTQEDEYLDCKCEKEMNLGGYTLEDLEKIVKSKSSEEQREFNSRIPNNMKFVSEVDIIPRDDVNGITSFEKRKSEENLCNLGGLNELNELGGLNELNELNELDGLTESTLTNLFGEAIEETDLDHQNSTKGSSKLQNTDTSILIVDELDLEMDSISSTDWNLDEIANSGNKLESVEDEVALDLKDLLSSGNIQDEELYTSETDVDIVSSELLEDKELQQEYEDMFDLHYQDYVNYVMSQFTEDDSEISEEEIEKLKPLKVLAMEYNNSIYLMEDEVLRDNLVTGLKYISQFKSEDGSKLNTVGKRGVKQWGEMSISKSMNVKKLNEILNGKSGTE